MTYRVQLKNKNNKTVTFLRDYLNPEDAVRFKVELLEEIEAALKDNEPIVFDAMYDPTLEYNSDVLVLSLKTMREGVTINIIYNED